MAQNAAWDPVVAGLVADASELDRSLCALHLAGAPPSPPPYPPMLPAGGYGIQLLCPPNTLHLGLAHGQMLAQGAVPAGPCWDLSAVATFRSALTPDTVDGLFRSSAPAVAVEFELANGTELRHMFSRSSFNQRVALTGLGNVWSTREMFEGAAFFNSPLALDGLGSTGKWTDAYRMFKDATCCINFQLYVYYVAQQQESGVTYAWRNKEATR